MDDPLLTIEELSKYINIKKATVYDLVYRKKIPYIKIGRLLRFKKSFIDQWIKLRLNVPFGMKICYNTKSGGSEE